jgi:pantoate kinase
MRGQTCFTLSQLLLAHQMAENAQRFLHSFCSQPQAANFFLRAYAFSKGAELCVAQFALTVPKLSALTTNCLASILREMLWHRMGRKRIAFSAPVCSSREAGRTFFSRACEFSKGTHFASRG